MKGLNEMTAEARAAYEAAKLLYHVINPPVRALAI